MKKMATIDTQDLDSLEPSMDAKINLGIKWVAVALSLEKELWHLKAQDFWNAHRLDHVHARFNGMKRALGL